METESYVAYHQVLEGHTYVKITAELDSSLNFLYANGSQERARRGSVRPLLRPSPAAREETSRGMLAAASFGPLAT